MICCLRKIVKIVDSSRTCIQQPTVPWFFSVFLSGEPTLLEITDDLCMHVCYVCMYVCVYECVRLYMFACMGDHLTNTV